MNQLESRVLSLVSQVAVYNNAKFPLIQLCNQDICNQRFRMKLRSVRVDLGSYFSALTKISSMFKQQVFIDTTIAIFVDAADGRSFRCQNLVHAGENLSRSCCLLSLSLLALFSLPIERSPFTTPPLLGAHAVASSSLHLLSRSGHGNFRQQF